jgi:hypothetical protein
MSANEKTRLDFERRLAQARADADKRRDERRQAREAQKRNVK